MKNRAKCKLCKDILESFHLYDHVTCKCGEISISGGRDTLECSAKNWSNFLRVDDNGNEIVIKVKGEDEQKAEDLPPLTKDDKIKMFEEMVKNIENLPQHAMSAPINHYDMFNYMAMILSILKHKKK